MSLSDLYDMRVDGAKVDDAHPVPTKDAALAALIGEVQTTPTANTLLSRVKALLTGIVLAAGTNLIGKVAPSADQDPVFDEANGATYTLAANASTTLITPPAGCKFMRISVTADTMIRTDDQAVSDNGKNAMIWAGTTDTIPVTAGTALRGFSTSASVVRCLPLKERP